MHPALLFIAKRLGTVLAAHQLYREICKDTDNAPAPMYVDSSWTANEGQKMIPDDLLLTDVVEIWFRISHQPGPHDRNFASRYYWVRDGSNTDIIFYRKV